VDEQLSVDGEVHACNVDRACYKYDPPATLRALYFNKGGGGVRALPAYTGFAKGKDVDCSKHYSTNARGLHPGIYDFNVSDHRLRRVRARGHPQLTRVRHCFCSRCAATVRARVLLWCATALWRAWPTALTREAREHGCAVNRHGCSRASHARPVRLAQGFTLFRPQKAVGTPQPWFLPIAKRHPSFLCTTTRAQPASTA
jgi:hypothetical protein